MSGLGRWSLGVGVGLLVVAVLCRALNLIPVTVITGLLGLIALGMAGYDAIYEWQGRADLRRREARAHREREGRQGR
jgi:cadmium resistance protein CadD (predicted permease)